MSNHGLLIASILVLESLVLARSASSQGAPGVQPAARVAHAASRPVVFEGFVLEPDGAPAEGAVVVSSAGGTAVTDWRGRYRFEAEVPREAESVQVTAAGAAATNLAASTSVPISAASRFARVEMLQLAQGLACHPRWLPTFGGTHPPNVNSMTVYDDGSGPTLYAGGGAFSQFAGGNRITKLELVGPRQRDEQ